MGIADGVVPLLPVNLGYVAEIPVGIGMQGIVRGAGVRLNLRPREHVEAERPRVVAPEPPESEALRAVAAAKGYIVDVGHLCSGSSAFSTSSIHSLFAGNLSGCPVLMK